MSRAKESSMSLRRSGSLSRSTDLTLSRVDEMCQIFDSLPPFQDRIILDQTLLEKAKKNSRAQKRPRSESFAEVNEVSPKNPRRSSLRSSSKSVGEVSADPSPALMKTEPQPNSERPTSSASSRASSIASSKPKSSREPADTDLKGLLEWARELKHSGDALRKESADSVKKNPENFCQENDQFDGFVDSYLRASLAYLRSCSLYDVEKNRPEGWLKQAQDIYKSTAALACFAAQGVTESSPVYRRTLASLCLKVASCAYSRRYILDRSLCAQLNAEAEESIRSSKVQDALKHLNKYRAATDECDKDVQLSFAYWLASFKVAPQQMSDFDHEAQQPLKVDLTNFLLYAKKELQRAKYEKNE